MAVTDTVETVQVGFKCGGNLFDLGRIRLSLMPKNNYFIQFLNPIFYTLFNLFMPHLPHVPHVLHVPHVPLFASCALFSVPSLFG